MGKAESQRRYWEEMLGTLHTICFGAITSRLHREDDRIVPDGGNT